ncbi:hypothetical protein C4559_02060 [Candidatus Microgenomates bacterium]|nr:MAG: hypothetical protein C4559_02060 [Candidatus Microgenomates bacterium]
MQKFFQRSITLKKSILKFLNLINSFIDSINLLTFQCLQTKIYCIMSFKDDMKSKCNFSYEHYIEILNLLKKRNYKFSFFSQKPNLKNKKIYLRHDVDFSLDTALQLAKIESGEQINSVYFIRLAGPFYNIFKTENVKILNEIISLGHQIGLHFEGDSGIDLYGKSIPKKEAIEYAVEKQIKTLKTYFKVSKIISFHCPHLAKSIINKSFKNFISTYSYDFFGKTKYLSDSTGNWREGCVCNLLKSDKTPNNLQLLMHPIWWGRKNKLNSDKHYYKNLWKLFKELDSASAREHPFYKKRYSV